VAEHLWGSNFNFEAASGRVPSSVSELWKFMPRKPVEQEYESSIKILSLSKRGGSRVHGGLERPEDWGDAVGPCAFFLFVLPSASQSNSTGNDIFRITERCGAAEPLLWCCLA